MLADLLKSLEIFTKAVDNKTPVVSVSMNGRYLLCILIVLEEYMFVESMFVAAMFVESMSGTKVQYGTRRVRVCPSTTLVLCSTLNRVSCTHPFYIFSHPVQKPIFGR